MRFHEAAIRVLRQQKAPATEQVFIAREVNSHATLGAERSRSARDRVPRAWVGLAVVILFACSMERSAEAGNNLVAAADANLALGLGAHGTSTGIGVAGRLGYRLGVPLVAMTPEIGLGYHWFDGDPKIVRGFGGVRLAFGELIKPSVFAHLGYGSASGGHQYDGVTYDVGAALDLTALPIFDIGIHADYAALNSSNTDGASAQWIDLGAHAALYF